MPTTTPTRLTRATDRVDPDTGEVLDEHQALERLIGLESVVSSIDRAIAEKNAELKLLKEERETRFGQMRSLIRIPTPMPTPLFDGDPTGR